ncbi:hypothetical protein MMC13_002237 [Lambiella insularis]|nr:hypothetical protein [Lambiella insularis]
MPLDGPFETVVPAPDDEALISSLGSSNYAHIAREALEFPLQDFSPSFSEGDGEVSRSDRPNKRFIEQGGYASHDGQISHSDRHVDPDYLVQDVNSVFARSTNALWLKQGTEQPKEQHYQLPQLPPIAFEDLDGDLAKLPSIKAMLQDPNLNLPSIRTITDGSDFDLLNSSHLLESRTRKSPSSSPKMRPMLENFPCAYPGCTASPFQTQNLLKHVKIHHVDKDRLDPQLQKVLQQRSVDGNLGRRRGLPLDNIWTQHFLQGELSLPEVTARQRNLDTLAVTKTVTGAEGEKGKGNRYKGQLKASDIILPSEKQPETTWLIRTAISPLDNVSPGDVNISRANIPDATMEENPHANLTTARSRVCSADKVPGIQLASCEKGDSVQADTYDVNSGSEHLDSLSDTFSIDSVPRMFSGTTLSSLSSTNEQLNGAVGQVITLLMEDAGLKPLLDRAFDRVSAEKFERNFTKLVKAYAVDLKFVASNELENGAVRLVYSQRKFIANAIRRTYIPDSDYTSQMLQDLTMQTPAKAEQLERFLQHKYSMFKTLDPDDGQSSDDSDMGEPDQPHLHNLERVIGFLTSGVPFEKLRKGLERFLYPANEVTSNVLQLGKSESTDGLHDMNTKRQKFPENYDMDIESTNRLPNLNLQQQEELPSQVFPMTRHERDELQIRQDSYHERPRASELEKRLIPPEPQPLGASIMKQGNCLPSSISDGDDDGQFTERHADQRMLVDFVSGDYALNYREASSASQKELPQLASGIEATHCKEQSSSEFGQNTNLGDSFNGALRIWWSRQCRPRLRRGCRRIEWICDCGKLLYGDFDNTVPEALNNLAIRLQNPGPDLMQQSNQQQSLDLNASPVAHISQSTETTSGHPRANQGPRRLQKSLPTACTMPPSPEPRSLKFVELYVNTGKWKKSLGEIDVTHVNCDGDLFALIRERYEAVRGFRTRFFLLEPAAVQWVQFSLENRYSVGILDKPMAVPPQSEVDGRRYEFHRGPLPPVPDNVFLHYLTEPGHHRRPKWLKRIPLKVNNSLVMHSDEEVIGWGVHIIEGPNWLALSLTTFCIMFAIVLFAILWSRCRSDISEAFTVAGSMTALLTAAIMVCLSKWSQE